MQVLTRWIVLRHIRLAPVRSFLTVLGTSIAVSGLVAITAASHAVVATYESSMEHLSGRVDVEIGSGDAPVPEALLEPLSQVRGVSHLSPVLEQKAHHPQSGEALLVLGLDLTGDTYFRSVHGVQADIDPVEFLNCRNCILLAQSFAQRQGIAAGDSMLLSTPSGLQTFTVKDLLRDEGPAQAYGGNVAIMYLDAAQIVFARTGRYDRIDVALFPEAPRAQVEQALATTVGPGIPVDRPSRRGERTASMMTRFRTGMQVVSALALIVCMFMIYNTIGMSVAQRRREIGVLRALGTTRAEIRGLFVREALALAAVGCAVGVVLGRALARGVLGSIHRTITNLYADVQFHNAEISMPLVLLAVVLCLITTALSAWLPSSVASNTPPAVAMQRSAVLPLPTVPWRQGIWLGLGIGAVAAGLAAIPPRWVSGYTGEASMIVSLLAAACWVPAGLQAASRLLRRPMRWLGGVPGQLAADNLRRDGTRAIVTVAALMVGLGLALGVSTFVNGFQHSVSEWLVQSVPADVFVTGSAPINQGNVRLPASLGPKLAALPHIQALEAVGVRKLLVQDVRVSALSVDVPLRLQHTKMKIVQGEVGDTQAFVSARKIMVSDNLAFRLNIHPGDTLPLNTPTGVQNYQVQCVFVDYTSDWGAVLLDRHNYVKDFADDTVDAYEIYLDDAPEGSDSVRAAIRADYGKDFDLFIMTNRQLREQAEILIRNTFKITTAMSVLAVVVALLGVMNTLVGAVVDRTRELGVLRAIGTGAGDVVRMFVYEALLLGACASVMGWGVGQVLGLLLVYVVNVQDTGWHVGLHPDWIYQGQVMLLAMAAAAVAAVVPARRGARQAITEALAYE